VRPPRFFRAAARLLAPADERDDALAHLRDEAEEIAARLGEPAGRAWYRRQVRRSIAPWLRRRAALTAGAIGRAWSHRGQAFGGLIKDARETLRSIRRAPAFAAIVVVTLAVGIGVNTAIFTVVDALLFKTLPYADGDRLVRVAEWPKVGGNFTVAPAAFLEWRTRARALSAMEARVGGRTGLLEGGDAEQLISARVTGGYFDLLGITAVRGRAIAAADTAPAEPCRAVVSHKLWVRRFGADLSAIGRPARFTDGPCTIVGVLPADSVFDRSTTDVYFPLVFTPELARSQGRTLTTLARLAPGVSVDQAHAELAAIAADFNATRGAAGQGWTVALTPMRDVVLRQDTRRLAWTLLAAVAVVLAVACVNVASLSLSRAVDRSRELVLRAALGASRWRMFRLLMVESVLLATTGAAAGVLTGSLALRLFLTLVPPGTLPAEAAVALDARALVFTAGLAMAAALVFGTLPAWRGAAASPARALAAGGRGASASRASSRLHNTLLAVEVALAMVLVTTAALLGVSFGRLTGVSPGFETAGIQTAQVAVPATRYPDAAAWAAFYERAIDAIRRQPHVQHASAVTSLPLGGWLFGARFAVEGTSVDPARPPSAHIQHTTRDYFETFGIPLVAGRSFAASDTAQAPLVAIVNQTFVRRFIPDGAAVNRRLTLGIDTTAGLSNQAWTIVGVAGDVKTGSLADRDLATPEIYVPHTQSPMPALVLAARAAPGRMADAASALRAGLRSVDPDLPLSAIVSMDERLGRSVSTQRFRTSMIVLFAALAGVLANLGVYAVRARAVRARRREMGVRTALGATRGEILRLLVGQAIWPVAAGLLIGAGASRLTSRALRQWLFETDAADPIVLAASAAALGGAALVASWLPARRAAGADPLAVLRHE
jgi:putative ABC transport system permease protein